MLINTLKKHIAVPLAALAIGAGLLGGCGPEPGAGNAAGAYRPSDTSLFTDTQAPTAEEKDTQAPAAVEKDAPADPAAAGNSGTGISGALASAAALPSEAQGQDGIAGKGQDGITAQGQDDSTAQEPGAQTSAEPGQRGVRLVTSELKKLEEKERELLQAYLNTKDSCLRDKLRERSDAGTGEAGSRSPEDGAGLTFLCTDAWAQEAYVIVHYRIETQAAENAEISAEGSTKAAEGRTQQAAEAATASGTQASAETAAEGSTQAAENGTQAAADTAAESMTRHSEAAKGSTKAAEGGTQTAAEGSTQAGEGGTRAEEAAAEGVTQAAARAASAASAVPHAPDAADGALREKSAFYEPVYEAVLEKTAGGYRLCGNVLWVQRGLIEAQSYQADLKPLGEVFFAPVYPDTAVDEKADVSFVLTRDGELVAVLDPVEDGNIRSDRAFTGVDAVDFTDYNGDGFTDILTVCSYSAVKKGSKKTQTVREARVYTGRGEGAPVLDRERTAAVNAGVQTLNITNVTGYLEGKNDGKDMKFGSWKEAFADHVTKAEKEEYDGFALIFLNDDRTPELVQVGATPAKGATVVVYKNGSLRETWLNRQSFQYLENENLLLCSSGVENLHYDTIYSIAGGMLGISSQGYYGNRNFARVQYDSSGRASYDYFWDGGEVSENGYRDGLDFIFDRSRAKTCGGEEGLMTAEEILEKLK